MVTFTLKKQDLLDVLKMISGALPRGKASSGSVAVEITVKEGKIDLIVPGAKFQIPCTTKGSCKAAILFVHLLHLIKSYKNPLIEVSITDSFLKVGNTEIGAKTTFFEDDKVLRSISLPINYTIIDLLKLPKRGYTPEEIAFNNLSTKYEDAKEDLRRKISNAANLLQIYGVKVEEIEAIVHKKLYE